jgi:hypothetical protein
VVRADHLGTDVRWPSYGSRTDREIHVEHRSNTNLVSSVIYREPAARSYSCPGSSRARGVGLVVARGVRHAAGRAPGARFTHGVCTVRATARLPIASTCHRCGGPVRPTTGPRRSRHGGADLRRVRGRTAIRERRDGTRATMLVVVVLGDLARAGSVRGSSARRGPSCSSPAGVAGSTTHGCGESTSMTAARVRREPR